MLRLVFRGGGGFPSSVPHVLRKPRSCLLRFCFRMRLRTWGIGQVYIPQRSHADPEESFQGPPWGAAHIFATDRAPSRVHSFSQIGNYRAADARSPAIKRWDPRAFPLSKGKNTASNPESQHLVRPRGGGGTRIHLQINIWSPCKKGAAGVPPADLLDLDRKHTLSNK